MSPPCTRCTAATSSVQLSSGAVCFSCFRTFLERTFRTSVGRLGVGGAPHRVALAVSGGPGSSALALLHAHYVSTLQFPPTNPPPPVLLLHALAVTSSPHPAVTKLSDLLPRANLQLVRLHPDLHQRLMAINEGTDRALFARAAVLHSLRTAAENAGCDTLLLGTVAHRAAADVLLALSSGRGADARVIAASGADTPDDVRIVRPLRDVPARLAFRYARAEMDNTAFDARGAAGLIGVYKSGLGDVVEKFVEAVGDGNAASVHNVVKTADKLRQGDGERWCGGCGGIVLQEELCYGCQEAARRAGGADVIRNVVRRREVGLEEMRKGIEDFLL